MTFRNREWKNLMDWMLDIKERGGQASISSSCLSKLGAQQCHFFKMEKTKRRTDFSLARAQIKSYVLEMSLLSCLLAIKWGVKRKWNVGSLTSTQCLIIVSVLCSLTFYLIVSISNSGILTLNFLTSSSVQKRHNDFSKALQLIWKSTT